MADYLVHHDTPSAARNHGTHLVHATCHRSKRKPRTAGNTAMQDGELMAQDQDFRGLPRLLTLRQPQLRGDARDQEEHEPQAHDW